MCAQLASPLSTYSDTTPQKRIITDFISLIDPSDAPLIDSLGGLDGASGKFRFVNGKSTVMEWLEDTLTSLVTSLNEGASITSTIVSMTTADATMLQKGHIIKIDTELAWVSAISGVSITVTRGVAGGTNATHTSTAAISVVGMARLEGADSDAVGFTDKTTTSNVTDIFHQEVKVNRSQRLMSQYGLDDEMKYQEDKVIPSLMRLIELEVLESKALAAGSATTPRIFGGIQAFVTTNKVSGATLSQAQFESAVMSIYQNGGTPPFNAYVSPVNYQKVKNFYDSSLFLKVERSETTVGMVIKQIATPFGEVNLILDRWCSNSIIPILCPANAGMVTYDPFHVDELAKTGDADKEEVVGEFSFCLRQQKSHALLTNVS